jgi:hypothetical protein
VSSSVIASKPKPERALMDRQEIPLNGIERLVERYKKAFRIPENLNHYRSEDYRVAEKLFVKFCLKNGSDWKGNS